MSRLAAAYHDRIVKLGASLDLHSRALKRERLGLADGERRVAELAQKCEDEEAELSDLRAALKPLEDSR